MHRSGRASAPIVFTRNALCGLTAPGIDVTPETLLDRLLDPAIKLGAQGRALPWLARRSPLITRGGQEPGGAVIWVAHLDWLGEPPANLFAAKAS